MALPSTLRLIAVLVVLVGVGVFALAITTGLPLGVEIGGAAILAAVILVVSARVLEGLGRR